LKTFELMEGNYTWQRVMWICPFFFRRHEKGFGYWNFEFISYHFLCFFRQNILSRLPWNSRKLHVRSTFMVFLWSFNSQKWFCQ